MLRRRARLARIFLREEWKTSGGMKESGAGNVHAIKAMQRTFSLPGASAFAWFRGSLSVPAFWRQFRRARAEIAMEEGKSRAIKLPRGPSRHKPDAFRGVPFPYAACIFWKRCLLADSSLTLRLSLFPLLSPTAEFY
jgi:hypothetical protein